MNGADRISFRVEKLDDPGDARNGRLGHHDLPAIRYDGAGGGVNIVHSDRTFDCDPCGHF
jgi:hypothetical protein